MLYKKVVSYLISILLFFDWVEIWFNEMVLGWSNSYVKIVKYIVNFWFILRFGD